MGPSRFPIRWERSISPSLIVIPNFDLKKSFAISSVFSLASGFMPWIRRQFFLEYCCSSSSSHFNSSFSFSNSSNLSFISKEIESQMICLNVSLLRTFSQIFFRYRINKTIIFFQLFNHLFIHSHKFSRWCQ